MGKTTITVDERTHRRFKELKAELDEFQDAPDHTSDSFLSALLDTWEAVDDGYYDPDTEAIAEQLEEIRNQLSMAPDSGVDEEQITQEVNKRIDDMETELKTMIEALQR